MFRAFQDWDESLWLRCLGCLIYEHLPEPNVPYAPIEGCHTRCANDIRCLQDLILRLPHEIFELLLLLLSQLTLILS